jgi:hypothetical protein
MFKIFILVKEKYVMMVARNKPMINADTDNKIVISPAFRINIS